MLFSVLGYVGSAAVGGIATYGKPAMFGPAVAFTGVGANDAPIALVGADVESARILIAKMAAVFPVGARGVVLSIDHAERLSSPPKDSNLLVLEQFDEWYVVTDRTDFKILTRAVGRANILDPVSWAEAEAAGEVTRPGNSYYAQRKRGVANVPASIKPDLINVVVYVSEVKLFPKDSKENADVKVQIMRSDGSVDPQGILSLKVFKFEHCVLTSAMVKLAGDCAQRPEALAVVGAYPDFYGKGSYAGPELNLYPGSYIALATKTPTVLKFLSEVNAPDAGSCGAGSSSQTASAEPSSSTSVTKDMGPSIVKVVFRGGQYPVSCLDLNGIFNGVDVAITDKATGDVVLGCYLPPGKVGLAVCNELWGPFKRFSTGVETDDMMAANRLDWIPLIKAPVDVTRVEIVDNQVIHVEKLKPEPKGSVTGDNV